MEESSVGNLSEEKILILKAKVNELQCTLARLNSWWKQRAKAKWLKDGDLNTRSCSLNNRPCPRAVLSDLDRALLNSELNLKEVSDFVTLLEGVLPGIDGITHSFIKTYWQIVKTEIWEALKQFFHTGIMESNWKDTLIVLISKVEMPMTPSNFRPISLCKTIYKLVAKILLNRMVNLLPKVISENQSAFIKGRSLTYNVLIAQEIFHKFRFSKSLKGLVSFKIDMEQAYDSMSWETLEQILSYFGFPLHFSKLILECLLSNALMQEEMEIGIKVHHNAPRISHLLYVDDILIFSEANFKMIKRIKSILQDYCNWSGQKINYNKSSILCGKAVSRRKKRKIARVMGFKLVKEFYYLGVKIALRRLMASDFSFLLEKVLGKLDTWGTKFISLARRMTLARMIILSIPVFYCMHSLVPNGGRGLKSCTQIIDSLRAKITWKYVNDEDSLLHKCLKPKYGNSGWIPEWKHSLSSTCKILRSGAKALKLIIRWNICNGEKINVLEDVWIFDKALCKWPTFLDNLHINDLCVDQFIENGTWNIAKLQNVFDNNLLQIICNVKIDQGAGIDQMELISYNSGKTLAALSDEALNKLGLWDVNQLSQLFKNSWHPPPPDWIKINVDNSLLSNYNAGIGAVGRDHLGRFIFAKGIKCTHWDIALLELEGILSLHGIIKDWNSQVQGIVIEGDNDNVMKSF
ncbi:uncharacterized protein LOC114581195 [Dendrobium catenatum]|uniref:uncharacterized protein LOC114581195 n=1 Tax=Dendrobium catenatum TaxID=906689 RepID=UPI0010A06193|nr:uncharacterized protein LOC114581195 [Dendrobium catenatum]